jgi:hypothetical protein
MSMTQVTQNNLNKIISPGRLLTAAQGPLKPNFKRVATKHASISNTQLDSKGDASLMISSKTKCTSKSQSGGFTFSNPFRNLNRLTMSAKQINILP